MSKFTKGARGIKKMFGSSGLKSLGDSLNMGKWATNIARGFGVQTRNKAPILSSKQVIDSSNRGNVTAAFGQLAGTGGAAQQMSPVTKTVNTLGERTLNSTGLGLQAAGNAAVYGGGIGTLGYMMKGDGTEAGVDENGIKNPGANEEMIKFREKFQKDKLGGSSTFSAPKYQALRSQSKWVDTAIKSIGAEQYKKMRTAVMNGELPPEKMHSFLTDAIAHDTEALKLAGKEPYVLPGVARTAGGEGRVVVMAPMAGKDKKTSYKAMQYGIEQQ
jgi:hypothetical protein